MTDKPTLESLVADFKAMEPHEKAGVLRFLASEETDRERQKKLIMAALRMDAIAMLPDEGPDWPNVPDSGKPFVDDAYYAKILSKRGPAK